MKIVSRKKKVPLLTINISDYVPYTIVPQDVKNFEIPFSQPVEPQPIPFNPPRQFTSIPVQTKRIRMTPRKPSREPSKSLVERKEKQKQ